jgi:hypothetical protein
MHFITLCVAVVLDDFHIVFWYGTPQVPAIGLKLLNVVVHGYVGKISDALLRCIKEHEWQLLHLYRHLST